MNYPESYYANYDEDGGKHMKGGHNLAQTPD